MIKEYRDQAILKLAAVKAFSKFLYAFFSRQFLIFSKLVSVAFLHIRFGFFFRHKPTLQNVQNRVVVVAFVPFLRGICHKILLIVVFLYTYLLFNPQNALSTDKSNTVLCPDGYAYRLNSGYYIPCESFDLFHAELFKGVTRIDLYLRGPK